MFKVEDYQTIGELTKEHAKEVIYNYGNLVKWPEGEATILDVGCGEGTTTATTLQDFINKNVNNYKIVGIDIMEDMILVAKEKFGGEKYIDFKQMDIGAEYIRYPSLIGHFDIAFSIFCLHWVPNTNWIKNIYTTLKPNGQVFLMVAIMNDLFEIIESEAKCGNWFEYSGKGKVFSSPLINSKEPTVWLTPGFEEAGFRNVTYKYISREIHFSNKNSLIGMLKGAPVLYKHIADEKVSEYLNYIVDELGKKNPVIDKTTEFTMTINYLLIIADK